MPNIHFDPSEFSSIVDMTVEAAVRRLREERSGGESGRILLNKKEAAAALGVSPSTLDRLRREAGLPAVKLDGLVLFRPASLDAWAAARESEGATPAPESLAEENPKNRYL